VANVVLRFGFDLISLILDCRISPVIQSEVRIVSQVSIVMSSTWVASSVGSGGIS